MDWGKVGTATLGALGAGVGGSAGASLGMSLLGSDGSGDFDFGETEMNALSFQKKIAKKQMKYGNKLDMKNQKEMFDYRINRGLKHGMTPYEMFMGPAAGAGGGTSGSGQTLGNAATQAANSIRAAKAQSDIAEREGQRDRATSLMQTAMQTKAQTDVAHINAGTQTRGQDIQKEIADNVLSLNQRELEEVKIPQAAQALKLSKQQLQTEINKTATSAPKFQQAMKQLSMGPANLLVELTLRDEGISLSDDSFNKLSDSDRKRILDKLVALSSSLYVETAGATSAVAEPVKAVGDNIVDFITRLIVGSKGGIELTNAPPNSPSLGSTMSEPYRPGPDMSYR